MLIVIAAAATLTTFFASCHINDKRSVYGWEIPAASFCALVVAIISAFVIAMTSMFVTVPIDDGGTIYEENIEDVGVNEGEHGWQISFAGKGVAEVPRKKDMHFSITSDDPAIQEGIDAGELIAEERIVACPLTALESKNLTFYGNADVIDKMKAKVDKDD